MCALCTYFTPYVLNSRHAPTNYVVYISYDNHTRGVESTDSSDEPIWSLAVHETGWYIKRACQPHGIVLEEGVRQMEALVDLAGWNQQGQSSYLGMDIKIAFFWKEFLNLS